MHQKFNIQKRHSKPQETSGGSVNQMDLIIQGPVIVNISDSEQSGGQQINDSGNPFSHIKPMDAEESQKGVQNPGDIVIDGPFAEPQIGFPVHGGNQKQIDDPADEQQPESKKIEGAGYRFSEIKPVRTGESEQPKDVADCFGVGICETPTFQDGTRRTSPDPPFAPHDTPCN